jgi:hypothetical protein
MSRFPDVSYTGRVKTLALALALLIGASGPALCQAVCAAGADRPTVAASVSCHEDAGNWAGPSLSAGGACAHDARTAPPSQATTVFQLAVVAVDLPVSFDGLIAGPAAPSAPTARSSPPPLLLPLRI